MSADFLAFSLDSDPADGPSGGQRDGRSPGRRRYRGEVPAMTRLFLPADAAAAPLDVKVAETRARVWASFWFSPSEVAGWLQVWPTAVPPVCAALRDAGVSPQAALTRLGFGKASPTEPTLLELVVCGEVSPAEAGARLRAAG